MEILELNPVKRSVFRSKTNFMIRSVIRYTTWGQTHVFQVGTLTMLVLFVLRRKQKWSYTSYLFDEVAMDSNNQYVLYEQRLLRKQAFRRTGGTGQEFTRDIM